MNDREKHSPALERRPAVQISTDRASPSLQPQECTIAVEEPITIDVGGGAAYTVMSSPTDRRALAVGFLFSEGLIDRMRHIDLLEECRDTPGVIRIRLSKDAPGGEDKKRNLLIVSSCGFCGAESLEKRLAALPGVGDTLRIKAGILRTLSDTMRGEQPLFRECGGTHATGIFLPTGEPISIAEDIGRHNALDKAIGKCLLSGRSPAGCLAMLSGRVSLEMVSKCTRAGIELIGAVSAPTSYAVRAADAWSITLCAFVRETRATVFTHPHRIEGMRNSTSL